MTSPPAPTGGTPINVNKPAGINGNQIAAEVLKFKGFPYVYGGSGPHSFDCSGLVQYVLTQLGLKNVPRTSEAQWSWVQKISASQLAPGDLVFAQFPSDTDPSPGHVGVYIGGGQILSAEDPAQGVGLDSLSNWSGSIVGYGRVPSSSAGTGATLDSSPGSALSGFDWTLGTPFEGLNWFGKIITGTSGSFATVGDVAKSITGLTRSMSKFLELFALLFRPEFWLRVGAFFFGLLALGAGLYFLKDSLT